MKAQDYPAAHFELMHRLARALADVPAQLLEHEYTYEAFGSWLVTIRYGGRVVQVAFDGRDKELTVRRSEDRKPPYAYGPSQTIDQADLDFTDDGRLVGQLVRAITETA